MGHSRWTTKGHVRATIIAAGTVTWAFILTGLFMWRDSFVPVIAVVATVMALIVTGLAFWREHKQPRDLERVLAGTGVPMEAIILEARDTGGRLNEVPKLAFVLEVRPKEGPPYKASAAKHVSILALHKCQPGATVKVLVDPNDPSRVALMAP